MATGRGSGAGGDAPSAAAFLPEEQTLPALREAAAGCRGCHLHERATQTVFGAGPVHAEVVLVGEQPGDTEDREGEPFVGPAGRVLDRALVEAGIDRDSVYVTNAVKHFKWTPRGKRRIHSKPNAEEIAACRPWLDAELAAVAPRLVVALGATAAQTLLGRGFKVTKQRGELHELPDGTAVTATVPPSSILRGPEDAREAAYRDFVDDLRGVAATVGIASR